MKRLSLSFNIDNTGVEFYLDAFDLFFKFFKKFFCIIARRKETIPLCEMSSEFVVSFNDYRMKSELFQLMSGLHSSRTSTYYQYIAFFHNYYRQQSTVNRQRFLSILLD